MGILSQLNAAEVTRLEETGRIEEHGRLKIYYYDTGGEIVSKPAVKIWRGKAKRPFANYRFRDDAARDAYVTEQIRNDEAAQKREAVNCLERKQRTEKMRAEIQVGTLLHYSWGYDQTQCEYFQVVERRGAVAIIREIAAVTVPGSEGFMCDRRKPERDRFIGDPIRKVIGAYGISMPYGGCSPCEDESEFYCSWYH